MRKKSSLALILIALFLVSCVQNPQAQNYAAYDPSLQGSLQYPPTPDFAAQATIAARQNADAAATYAVASTREAERVFALTRQSQQATEQAADIATGTAQARADIATGTAEAYVAAYMATRDALTARQTESAINVTATAQAQIAAFEATIAADEAQRLQQQRLAEVARAQRIERWNVFFYWLAVVLGAALVVAIGFAIANWWRHQQPLLQVANGGQQVILVRSAQDGEYRLLPKSEPLALPAPRYEEEAPSVPNGYAVNLPRFGRGHVLIAGETGSGKTNAMRAVLQHRSNVVVLDPHDAPRKWGRHVAIGGGRDFEAIGRYMEGMAAQLTTRYKQHNEGKDDFEPLTVAVDEMPAIIAAIGNNVADIWRQWLREGRKVGLFLVTATQSTRVRTLGIEGESDLLENFQCVLVLGKLAEARHPDLVRGSGPYPAVMETLGATRAVRVPLIEAPPSSGHSNGNGNGQRQPRVVAPAVEPLKTKGGEVTPVQIAKILRLKREGWSNAQIETTVFNQDTPGGNAYYKVKAVLDAYGAGVGPVE